MFTIDNFKEQCAKVDGKLSEDENNMMCSSDLVSKVEVRDHVVKSQEVKSVLISVDVDPEGSSFYKLFKAENVDPGHMIFAHDKKSVLSTLFNGMVWHHFLKPTKCTISGSKFKDDGMIHSVGLKCDL